MFRNQYHWLRLCFVLAVTLAAFGCDSARALRQAQDAFSEGARVELNQQWEPIRATNGLSDTPAPTTLSPQGYYRAALEHLEEANQAELHQDQLLPNRQVLEALCLWKLGEENATAPLDDPRIATINLQTHPREAILKQAIPGLIKISQAYRAIRDCEPGQETQMLQTVREQVTSARNNELNLAIQTAKSIDHPMIDYLMQARMSGWKCLLDAYAKAQPNDPSMTAEERNLATTDLQAFTDALRVRFPQEDQKAYVAELSSRWMGVTGAGTPTIR